MKKVILALLVLVLLVSAFAFVVSNDQLAASIDDDAQLAGSGSTNKGVPGAGAGAYGSGGGKPANTP